MGEAQEPPAGQAPTARQEAREAQAIQDRRSIWSPTHSGGISETEELASTKNIAHATNRKRKAQYLEGKKMKEQRTVGERMSKPKGGHLPALTEGRLVWKGTLTHLQGARSSPSLSRGRGTGPRETVTEENGQQAVSTLNGSCPASHQLCRWTESPSLVPSPPGRCAPVTASDLRHRRRAWRSGTVGPTGQAKGSSGAVSWKELSLWERVRCSVS